MTMLVTGADGAVGSYAESVFGAPNVSLTDVRDMDITDPGSVEEVFLRVRPEAVLHLAAATDVEGCEDREEDAFRINEAGVRVVAKACRRAGARMVYLSTGMVFDGEKDAPYVEADPPAASPPTVYGRSKLAGEFAVRDTLDDHLIIRCSWMIGGGRRDRKFVRKVLELMSLGEPLRVVDDVFGSLTYARHLLLQIAGLLKTRETGIFHAVNAGKVSRYDVALELSRLTGSRAEIRPVPGKSFPQKAPRGRSEALENARLKALGIDRMPGWKKALAEYLRELEADGVLKDGKIV